MHRQSCPVKPLRLLLLGSAIALGACSSQPQTTLQSGAANPAQPEAASGWTAKPGWAFTREAVAAAHPLAVEAGAEVLRRGGTAMDAAVAVQAMLGLVEPQSSGLGGGAFMLYFDGSKTFAYDGRETAPKAATPELFLGADGKPMRFAEAVPGGRAVGAPGVVPMLELAHRAHGKLAWASLFETSIRRAKDGFELGPRLHRLLEVDPHLRRDPTARSHFYGSDDKPLPVGTLLKNPEMAALLEAIAVRQSKALNEGQFAQALLQKVQNHPTNPGVLALADLQAYTPKVREALCTDWRELRICGFPPPSSGGIAVAQILKLLDHSEHKPSKWASLSAGVQNAEFVHYFAQASRLAFADRARYVADPDFVSAPGAGWHSLLDDAYLKPRAALMQGQATPPFEAGVPQGVRVGYAPSIDSEVPATTHISIVDRFGNAVAMTATIENQFGARVMVNRGVGLPGGFLLNNQLTDFSFSPRNAQGLIANRVEPGKRPRSSMSPTLVFKRSSGELVASLGSPGGAAIIAYTAKALLGHFAFGLSMQDAINLPNITNPNSITTLEAKLFSQETVAALKARGHEVREAELTSGLHGISRTRGIFQSGAWQAGADPRREGIAAGQ